MLNNAGSLFGLLAFVACIFASSCSNTTHDVQLIVTTEALFSEPESAVFHPESNTVFVSNVNGYSKDGNGFISRINSDGSIHSLKWLTGLNSPTGITIDNNSLYVVDYDALVVVDIAAANIVNRYPAPDEKPSLNDVVVSETGEVFVSGSSSNAIYKLVDNQLTVWKQDDALLKWANGLFIQNNQLWIGGKYFLTVDLSTGELSQVANSLVSNIDGITSDDCGGLLLTLIDDKRIWHHHPDGFQHPLSEAEIDGIDLSRHDDPLWIPQVGGKLAQYRLPQSRCVF